LASVAKLSPRNEADVRRSPSSGTSFNYIADVFEGAGLVAVLLPEGKVISGQHRNVVEQFYAGINWLDATP